MLETVLHLFRKHFRPALLIMLAAAALTFSGTVLVSIVTKGVERETAEADLRARQGNLEARVTKIEEESGRASGILAGLQKAIDAKGGDTARNGVDAPFPLESVVPSLVRLVCIDNKEDKTYFTSTGEIVDTTGLILTNSHALSSKDGSLIKFCGVGFTSDIQTPPIITYVATVVAVHKDVDLALLQITERLDGKKLPGSFSAITLGDRSVAFVTPPLGESVFIGGYPGIGADTLTFTQGVVSGHVGSNLIKTSALIDSGMSGGAVFDLHGRYIGIATAAVPGEIGGSLGYLVSASAVDAFLNEYYAGKGLVTPTVQ